MVYPLLDGLGSLRHLTDTNGDLILSRFYNAWGTVRHSSGTANSRLGFTGELVDGTTGLVYLRARWYNTSTGTFTSRDSFPGIPTRPQSLHRFIYTENNPVNYTDPTGQCRPESMPLVGEQGCDWFWRTGGFDAGQAFGDMFTWYWNVFQNIGLPGAIAGDYINTLRGQPTNMTEHILGQDQAAAFLGNAFREVALIGAGAHIPTLGKALAGWQWSRAMVNLVCTPYSREQSFGAIADTIVLVLVLKGGPTAVNIPRISGGSFSNLGGVAALQQYVVDTIVIKGNTQVLAGAVAGARSGGLTVLLAQSGSGGGSNHGNQQFESNAKLQDHFRRHGNENGLAYSNAKSYLDGARTLIQEGLDNLRQPGKNKDVLCVRRSDGSTVFYRLSTNEFLALLPGDKTIKTYFVPNDGFEYWSKEIMR